MIYSLKVDGFREKESISSIINLAKHFKIQYALEDKIWAYYEGGNVAISSSSYNKGTLTISPPLVARYVRIYMGITSTESTCIKLQLYGCKAFLKDNTTITTTPLTTNNTTSTVTFPTTTTEMIEARIFYYKIQQGQQYSSDVSWLDTEYKGTTTPNKELTSGTGCLVDNKHTESVNPFKRPYCWVGWKKINVSNPSIHITMSRLAPITGIYLRTYVDENIGVSTIKKFTVKTTEFDGRLAEVNGYACAPTSSYHISSQVIDYEINVGNTKAQYITLDMEYSGEWILVRQVMIKQDAVSAGALQLSKNSIECVIPIKEDWKTGDDDSSKIVIVICVVLALLFVAVGAFLIYRFWRKPHSPLEVSYKNNRKGSAGSEEEYAYPEMENVKIGASLLSSNKPSSTQHYEVTDDIENYTSIYASPDVNPYTKLTKQYSPLYQGVAIYDNKSKNPYMSMALSTIVYEEPSKVIRTKLSSSVKDFPRDQLSFKEKIGMNQFGEVHIAEARGLNDIYSSIGHYTNSSSLRDRAEVIVKTLKCDDKEMKAIFLKDVETMAELKHENVVRLLGVCQDKPMIMVCEYMDNGDMYKYLRQRIHINEKNADARSNTSDVLLTDSLLYMARQISAGMKYLHSEGFIHRDLATRNCLVGPAYQIKIVDFGLIRSLYDQHYYRVKEDVVLPIRWMAPECLYYGKFTNKTDVWSFGVTVWEIFTFARYTPYADFEDSQITESACKSVQIPDREFIRLKRPTHCPDKVYELMVKCWQKDPDCRPPFALLNRQLMELGDMFKNNDK